MKAYVITLRGNEYSERVAARCIGSGCDAGIQVKYFNAVTADEAAKVMENRGLKWTWGEYTARGLKHHSYGGNDAARIGCAMSHYALWEKCAWSGKPLLILEHDAVFINPFVAFEFDSACMINDPAGATPRGDFWHEEMVKRGDGVWPKTRIFTSNRPDGLAGGSAYVLQPHTALHLMELTREIGVWPNDALLCRQLVDGLQEHYPFITEVRPEQSTI